MQDGPEVGLICRIRFLFGVTIADQGPIPASAKCIFKKADQGTEDDRRQEPPPGKMTETNQESQRQIRPTERPIRRRLQPSERHEHAVIIEFQLYIETKKASPEKRLASILKERRIYLLNAGLGLSTFAVGAEASGLPKGLLRARSTNKGAATKIDE